MLSKGAYLHVVYADDVRDEADGRASIVGWYQQHSGIDLEKLQTKILRRLSVCASLCLPEDLDISSIKVVLRFNDVEVTTQDVTEEIKNEPPEALQYQGKPVNPPIFNFIFMIGNMPIHEPTLISVVAFVNDVEIHGNRFLVTSS